MTEVIRSFDHVFWADDLPYSQAVMGVVTRHTGVTDAYLASLAREYAGRVPTIDRRFARRCPDVVEAIELTPL